MALKIKLAIGAGILLVVLAVIAAIYHTGKDVAQTEQKVKTYEANEAATERKNAVPVPDAVSTVGRLREGTF